MNNLRRGFFRDTRGRTHSIEYPNGSTVEDIAQLLSNKMAKDGSNIPVSDIRLIYQGKVLQSDTMYAPSPGDHDARVVISNPDNDRQLYRERRVSERNKLQEQLNNLTFLPFASIHVNGLDHNGNEKPIGSMPINAETADILRNMMIQMASKELNDFNVRHPDLD